MSNECRLVDVAGQTVAMGLRDQMLSFLKHHTSDGEYAVAGPGIDARFHRVGGVVCPCGGIIDGEAIPVRSLEECVAFFGPTSNSNAENTGGVLSDDECMRGLEALSEGEEVPPGPRTPSLKAKVCERLRAVGIARVVVRYDGYGDVECIEEVTATKTDRTETELSEGDRELVEEYLCDRLPGGWEIDEGSFGEVVIDVVAGAVTFVHNERYLDNTTEHWEE